MTPQPMRLHPRGPQLRATKTDSFILTPRPPVVDLSPTSTGQPAVANPPLSKTGVAVVISVVGALLIIGIVIYNYLTRSRNKILLSAPSLAGKVTVERSYDSQQRIDFDNLSVYAEKPQDVALTPRPLDNQVGWVPQIRSYHADVPIPPPASLTTERKSRTARTITESAFSIVRSPPPSYHSRNHDIQDNRLIPISPFAPTSTVQVPFTATRTNLLSSMELSYPSMFTPSPRSESFAPGTLQRTSNISSVDGSAKLPRLMTVGVTFTPSLPDELSIKPGETVRLLEEYRDGWSLVQTLTDASKGTVPRFCLQERQGPIAA